MSGLSEEQLWEPSDWLIGQNGYGLQKYLGLWRWSLVRLGPWQECIGWVVLLSDQLQRLWRGVWWWSTLSRHSTHVHSQWTRTNPRPAPASNTLSSQHPNTTRETDLRMLYQQASQRVGKRTRAASSSDDSWQLVTADLRQSPSSCSKLWLRYEHFILWSKYNFKMLYLNNTDSNYIIHRNTGNNEELQFAAPPTFYLEKIFRGL